MARTPSREPRGPAATPSASNGNGASNGTVRDRVIAAFLGLLAEKSFERIGFAEIAERAGVTLADIRSEFDSTLGIYAAHVKTC
jgi:AcrR family transcriptional regulator